MIGIYKITNPEGKVYVGQSVNIKERFGKYKALDCKNQVKIFRSLRKYGVENHQFEILCECTPLELDALERHYINLYDSIAAGLNIREGGSNGKLSSEHKNKIRNALLGRRRPAYVVEKVRASLTGRKLSEKQRLELKEITKKNARFIYYNRKEVIDTITGESFISLKEAAKIRNLNYNTLKGKLNGTKPNNTSLVYVA